MLLKTGTENNEQIKSVTLRISEQKDMELGNSNAPNTGLFVNTPSFEVPPYNVPAEIRKSAVEKWYVDMMIGLGLLLNLTFIIFAASQEEVQEVSANCKGK